MALQVESAAKGTHTAFAKVRKIILRIWKDSIDVMNNAHFLVFANVQEHASQILLYFSLFEFLA